MLNKERLDNMKIGDGELDMVNGGMKVDIAKNISDIENSVNTKGSTATPSQGALHAGGNAGKAKPCPLCGNVTNVVQQIDGSFYCTVHNMVVS